MNELARVRAALDEITGEYRDEARWRSWYRRIMDAGVNHTGLTGYDLSHYERKQEERNRRLRGDEDDIF
jgi:hypothetical protein